MTVRYPNGPFAANESIEVEARWDSHCAVTTWDVVLSTRKDGEHTINLSVEKSQGTTSCAGQDFTAKATCVPGPCVVVKGGRGGTRPISIGFGAPGHHQVTLSVDNGRIHKQRSFEVDLYEADALKLTCEAKVDGELVPCGQQQFPPGTEFTFRAEVYSRGTLLPHAFPDITSGSLFAENLRGGRGELSFSVPVPLSSAMVTASYDGLVATYLLKVPLPVSP